MKFNQGLVLQILIPCSAILPFLFIGISHGWTSAYLPMLEKGDPIQISTAEKEEILACTPSGKIIGTLLGALLTNIGRKYKIVAVTLCHLIGSLLMSFPKSSLVLCISQVIIGMGDGCAAIIVPLYIGEIVHHKIRGAIGISWFLLLNIGYLVTNILGTYLELSQFGYLLTAIALVCFSTTIWLPESPHFLVYTKKYDKAVKALKRITRKEENIENKINEIKSTIIKQQGTNPKFIEILRKKSNQKIILTLILVFNGKFCSGIYALTTFSQSIFDTLFDIISPVSVTSIFFITKIISIFLCMVVIDKIGRKLCLLTAFAIACCTLMIMAIYLHLKTNNILEISDLFQYILLVILVLHTIVTSILSGIPEVILAELLPMNMKTFGSLFFGVFTVASSGIQTELFQLILDYSGMSLSFLILSVLSFVHSILAYFYIFETKGKTLEEIQENFQHT